MWLDKDFEESMRPYIDEIYNSVWSDLTNIIRSDRAATKNEISLLLDKHCGIDTIIHHKCGGILTLQEKTIRDENRRFQTITIEYYNDPKKNAIGDWFTLIAQLYFFGYASVDATGYTQWYILDMAKFRSWSFTEFSTNLKDCTMYWHQN